MLNPVRHHVESFLKGMVKHVMRTIWGIIRTGLVTFILVGLIGIGVITFIAHQVGGSPLGPLTVTSYVVVILAAFAAGIAASAIHLSLAVMRAIERAGKDVLAEIDKVEGEVVRSVLGGGHRPPELPGGRS